MYSVDSKGAKLHLMKLLTFAILVWLFLSANANAADRFYDIQNSSNSSIAVFVHGFTGDYIKTWKDLPRLLQRDEALDNYDFLFWGYPSKFFGNNETIGFTGEHLKTEIDFLPKKYDTIVLIGHSMGGLVIRSYIVKTLIDGNGNALSEIADVIFFGVPNDGLMKAEFVPEIINKQIGDLGVASKFIINLRKHWIQRVTAAPRDDDYNRKLKTLAVAGYQDHFVSKESVQSFFKETAVTDGDHISMVKPNNNLHLTYRIIQKRLLQAHLRKVKIGGATDSKYSKEIWSKNWEFLKLERLNRKSRNCKGINGDYEVYDRRPIIRSLESLILDSTPKLQKLRTNLLSEINNSPIATNEKCSTLGDYPNINLLMVEALKSKWDTLKIEVKSKASSAGVDLTFRWDI